MDEPYLTQEQTDESWPHWGFNQNVNQCRFNQTSLEWDQQDYTTDEPNDVFELQRQLDISQFDISQYPATHPLDLVPPTLQDHSGYSHPIGQYSPQVGLAPALPQQTVQIPTPTFGVGVAGDSGSNTCAHPSCGRTFPSRAKLNDHARTENHQAFRCHCGSRFTRSDALTRHAKKHSPGQSAKYECPLCEKYNGDKAFGRRDGLRQHLKVWHRIEESSLWFDIHSNSGDNTAPFQPLPDVIPEYQAFGL